MTSLIRNNRFNRLRPAKLADVRIRDNFFDRYTKLVQSAVIPYQWDALNDQLPDTEPSHSIQNFRVAAGLEEGTFHGFIFQDSDAAKWLEAVGYSLAHEANVELEAKADSLIELIGQAQEEDGYLNTYFQLKAPDSKWKNLCDCHELYVAGHFIEAAVAYYQGTGKTALLDIVCRFADLIAQVFGPDEDQIHGYPGHEEIELALVRLWEVTKEDRYLALAKYFIDQRGREPNYFEAEREQDDFFDFYHNKNHKPILEYHQAEKPVREMDTAGGHAVRAVYLYAGMADVAAATGDQQLLDAAIRLYDNIVEKQLYITGGIGKSNHLERFSVDYDLPNDANYSETCASIGLALFALRLGQITKQAHYHDTVELALYNTVLSGIAMDGKSFFYVNPMEVWPHNCKEHTMRASLKPQRQPWFGCACCPPNLARLLSSLALYACSVKEKDLLLNLYIQGELQVQVANQAVSLEVTTDYPHDGRIRIRAGAGDYNLLLRLPAWCRDHSLTRDGKPLEAPLQGGYLRLAGPFADTEILLNLHMAPQRVYMNPMAPEECGKTALMRGPLVYCLEEKDNGPHLHQLRLPKDAPLTFDRDPALPGGYRITAPGLRLVHETEDLYSTSPGRLIPQDLTFIPYHAWANRGENEMRVWVQEG